jgi:hypothetical protein
MKFRFKASRGRSGKVFKIDGEPADFGKDVRQRFQSQPVRPTIARAQNQQLVGLLRQNHLCGGH